MDATVIRAGLLKGGRISRYTLSNSSIEVIDVVAERNPRAFESDGQRWRLSTPIAPSSLTYFYHSSALYPVVFGRKPRCRILDIKRPTLPSRRKDG